MRRDHCGQLREALLERTDRLEYNHFGIMGTGALARVGRFRGSVVIRLATTLSTAA